MFRRKEEGLFDSDTDQEQLMEESAQDEKSASSAVTSPSATSSAAMAAAGVSSQSSVSSSSMSNQSAPRPNSTPQTASSFRPAPAVPLASELTRARMPEAKSSATASGVSSSVSGDKSKAGQRVLTVGNDILLKGEIATCDRLVIEGKVDATLNDVHTVEIAECGSFKGSAQIEDAEISGLFEGDLTVRGRLIIYSTGKVRGKISYGEIEIERGGELTGEIKITGASASSPRIPSRNSVKDDKVAA